MKKSESIKEIAVALNAFQCEVEQPKRDTQAYNYKYATMDSIWDVIKHPLHDNGLSVLQSPMNCSCGDIGVTTLLMHTSGEFISTAFATKPSKTDPQSIGSLITYYRRYALMAVLGLAPADDDGQAAMPQNTASQPQNHGMNSWKDQALGKLDPQTYVIGFGKWKGQRLTNIALNELQSYVEYIEGKAKDDGKELQGTVLEFCNMVDKLSGTK